MVVDTSALIAIILHEHERILFRDLILRSSPSVISTASLLEATIVLNNKRGDVELKILDEAVSTLGLDIVGVDEQQGRLARQAFLDFGRGRNPAALNFGDCFSYALAKLRNDTLLFKGDDFIHTDIVPAWRP